MHEKLIKLIREGEKKIVIADLMTPEQQKEYIYSQLADHLIANGVTVQRWIPVTERLPDGMEWVLCACRDGEIYMLCYDCIMDDWNICHRPTCYGKAFVTHWMPLPDPPKGE